MEEVAKSLENSIGPKASIGALDAPRHAAQLAVFGDPFEKRIEKILLDGLQLVKEGIAKLPGDNPDPVVGR